MAAESFRAMISLSCSNFSWMLVNWLIVFGLKSISVSK